MTLSTMPNPVTDTLSAADVDHYLRQHPEFFRDHLTLLEILTVPHPSGDAVSLVSRQLGVMREKNQRLARQLEDLVSIARENDGVYQRLHQITLALLDAKTVEDVIEGLDGGLHQYFQADFVAVRIAKPELDFSLADMMLAPASRGWVFCQSILESGKPRCGTLGSDEADVIFGADADAVGSCVIVPLQHAGLMGLFAIGSRDAERFREEMGMVFLQQMSEILAARLSALLNS
jgi:uncharacterized protein YigA (DUF484 family)